jgi:hypothetical protein
MLRTLMGLAAGLAVAIVTIMIVEAIGNQLFPPPHGYDMTEASTMALPIQTLMWPVIGWFAGSLTGSAIAVHLSHQRWAGWAITGLVLAAMVLNFAMITHPLWMMVAGPLAAILGGWIGQQIAGRTRRGA